VPVVKLNSNKTLDISNGVVGVTIGNFDGIHLGHQELFKQLFKKTKALAEKEGKEAINILVSFYPHPKIVLKKVSPEVQKEDSSYWSITPLKSKAVFAKRHGFDCFYPIRFRKSIASLSPEQFIKDYLCDVLGIKVAVVGYDWSFGKNKAGNPETLTELGEKYGFETIVVPRVMQGKVRVSSSEVKKALNAGNLKSLKNFLGRDFSICEKVVSGEKRGRTIGFPTANIIPLKQLLLPFGVYATKLLVDDVLYSAVTNLGVRPTFAGETTSIETHVLGETGLSLYGKKVEVIFIENIRAEKKFSSLDELKAQISADCLKAKEIHGI